MNIQCNDNRYEMIEKYKKILFEWTNIEHSEDEMKALDDFMFRLWQISWLERLNKYEKIRNLYNEWEEKINGIFGADDETSDFIVNLRKIIKEDAK